MKSSCPPPSFDDIKTSTTTVIVGTNIDIDLDQLFEVLPIAKLQNVPNSVKNNKKLGEYLEDIQLKHGSIILVQYKGNMRGFKIQRKTAKTTSNKFFRNALSLVLFVGKLITIKIPRQGKLQMTGCVTDYHAVDCVKSLWAILQELETPYPHLFRLLNKPYLTTMMRTVMTNIDFNFGFPINRQKLDWHMNHNTHFNSLLETSFGYTGVNIKKQFLLNDELSDIKSLDCLPNGEWKTGTVTYKEYLASLSDNERRKELSKVHKNTFLVFHSGTAIMSGMSRTYMKDVYHHFIDIIKEVQDIVQERIDS